MMKPREDHAAWSQVFRTYLDNNNLSAGIFYLASLGLFIVFSLIVVVVLEPTFFIQRPESDDDLAFAYILHQLITISLIGAIALIVPSWLYRRSKSSFEQERLAVLNNTTAVIYIKDLAGRYTFVNRRFEELFHVTNEELKGRSDYDLFPKEQADAFRANDMNALEARASIESEEVVRHEDGDHIYISVKFPLYKMDGAVYATCGISTDITERKRGEKHLLRAKEIAEQTNLIKANFLAKLNHELRTPLNAILMFLNLLATEEGSSLSSGQKNCVAQINNGSRLLLDFVNRSIDLASIEANEVSLDYRAVTVNRVVQECIHLVKPFATEKGVSIESGFAEAKPIMLIVDQLRLKQILINLLKNAIQYNNEGGEVLVSCEEIEDDYLRFVVQDSGIGIPADIQPEVFQPYWRLENISQDRHGWGIGLSVVQMLVEKMNGRTGFSSIEGEGSRFWFGLPKTPPGLYKITERPDDCVCSYPEPCPCTNPCY